MLFILVTVKMQFDRTGVKTKKSMQLHCVSGYIVFNVGGWFWETILTNHRTAYGECLKSRVNTKLHFDNIIWYYKVICVLACVMVHVSFTKVRIIWYRGRKVYKRSLRPCNETRSSVRYTIRLLLSCRIHAFASGKIVRAIYFPDSPNIWLWGSSRNSSTKFLLPFWNSWWYRRWSSRRISHDMRRLNWFSSKGILGSD